MENTFAFILHPLSTEDVARKYRFARHLPERWVEALLSLMRPQYLSKITGIASPTGASCEGFFVGCFRTTRQLLNGDERKVVRTIVDCGKLAQDRGARIIGLGAFTKIVGGGGVAVAEGLEVPVTTGNTYTVATALEGAFGACAAMGVSLQECAAGVVGATGSIGRVCSRVLRRKVGSLVLLGRDHQRLQALANELSDVPGCPVSISTDPHQSLPQLDLIISVTSGLDTVIGPEDLKPGAVVCDVARPRDVSREVAEARDDVLVIEGGVVEVPGDVDFGFDFGFPPKMAFACMAEPMILALEGRFESYSLGRQLSEEKVTEISALAAKHGFKVAGFRSFERALTEEEISRIRERAGRG